MDGLFIAARHLLSNITRGTLISHEDIAYVIYFGISCTTRGFWAQTEHLLTIFFYISELISGQYKISLALLRQDFTPR